MAKTPSAKKRSTKPKPRTSGSKWKKTSFKPRISDTYILNRLSCQADVAQADPESIKLLNLPKGSYFWYAESVYEKPTELVTPDFSLEGVSPSFAEAKRAAEAAIDVLAPIVKRTLETMHFLIGAKSIRVVPRSYKKPRLHGRRPITPSTT